MNKRIVLYIISISIMGSVALANTPPTDSKAYVSQVITKINEGDRHILKDIRYTNLEYILEYFRETSSEMIFYGKRGKIVNSALKGLFNKDPRVRLICIEILRRFNPDRFMMPEVKKAYHNETAISLNSKRLIKSINDYEYRSLSGYKIKKNKVEEITKLYHYVKRDQLVYKMLWKNPNILKEIGKGDFLLLTKRISNEKEEDIPFKSFGKRKFFKHNQLQIIINGLDNPNITVKRECANYLINFYNYNASQLDMHFRNQIKIALKKAYDDYIIPKPRLVRSR